MIEHNQLSFLGALFEASIGGEPLRYKLYAMAEIFENLPQYPNQSSLQIHWIEVLLRVFKCLEKNKEVVNVLSKAIKVSNQAIISSAQMLTEYCSFN